MADTTPQGPKGKFVWYEYMGDDLAGAADFYAHVVGWRIEDASMADFDYRLGVVGEHRVVGLMKLSADAKAMGAKACWTGYIWVPDVDAAAAKLAADGGKVLRPASDIPSVGRFAVVADPQGAVFMLFRDAGGNPPPPPSPNTPGLVGWHELAATDGAAALKFYTDTFGWRKDSEFDMGPMGPYHLFSTGHGEFGGIFTKRPEMPGPFWLYYFNVEAIDAGVARLTGKGGKVVNGPMEVPGGMWIVQATDNQGAFFALVAPRR
jgi:predicted enzyme related to lactoylglutathione lyase